MKIKCNIEAEESWLRVKQHRKNLFTDIYQIQILWSVYSKFWLNKKYKFFRFVYFSFACNFPSTNMLLVLSSKIHWEEGHLVFPSTIKYIWKKLLKKKHKISLQLVPCNSQNYIQLVKAVPRMIPKAHCWF